MELESPAQTGGLGRGKGTECLQMGAIAQELIGDRDCKAGRSPPGTPASSNVVYHSFRARYGQ